MTKLVALYYQMVVMVMVMLWSWTRKLFVFVRRGPKMNSLRTILVVNQGLKQE